MISLVARQILQPSARTARLIPYWAKVAMAPVEQQVMSLPRRVLHREFWIELDSITLASDVRHWRRPHHGFAVDGEWDVAHVSRRPSILEPSRVVTVKSLTHATIRALFIDGMPHRSTPQYEAMVEAVRQKDAQRAYGCTRVEEVEDYFERLLSAHRSMMTDGYRSQRELGLPAWDEVKVYITRDGRFCHGNGGNHRIRIAELLDIEWIPIVIAGAHRDWLVSLSRQYGRPPRSALFRWVSAQEKSGVLRPCRPST